MNIILPVEIEIVESNKQYGPGSTGFAFISKALFPYNVAKYSVVFNRFGKSGKSRLHYARIFAPLIDINTIIPDELCRVYEDIKYTEFFEPRKQHARRGNSRFMTPSITNLHGVKLKFLESSPEDLLYADIWKFFSYITSLSIQISQAINGFQLYNNTNIFVNRAIDFLLDINLPPVLGQHILHAFHISDKNKKDHYNAAKLNDFKDMFSGINNRKAILNILHADIKRLRVIVVDHLNDIHEKRKLIHKAVVEVSNTYANDESARVRASVGYDSSLVDYPRPIRQGILNSRTPNLRVGRINPIRRSPSRGGRISRDRGMAENPPNAHTVPQIDPLSPIDPVDNGYDNSCAAEPPTYHLRSDYSVDASNIDTGVVMEVASDAENSVGMGNAPVYDGNLDEALREFDDGTEGIGCGDDNIEDIVELNLGDGDRIADEIREGFGKWITPVQQASRRYRFRS